MKDALVPGSVYVVLRSDVSDYIDTVIVLWLAKSAYNEPRWIVMEKDGNVIIYSEYSLVTYYTSVTRL